MGKTKTARQLKTVRCATGGGGACQDVVHASVCRRPVALVSGHRGVEQFLPRAHLSVPSSVNPSVNKKQRCVTTIHTTIDHKKEEENPPEQRPRQGGHGSCAVVVAPPGPKRAAQGR